MHYNGKADGGATSGWSSCGASGGSAGLSEIPMPRYRVAIMRNGAKTWLPWMRGTLESDGWFTKSMNGGTLIALTVYYDTPNPSVIGYYAAKCRTHWLGSSPVWGKWEYDDNYDGAGNDRDQLDMIEFTIDAV